MVVFDFTNLKITSPKRNPKGQAGWEGFFPYYAGYTEIFAHNILHSSGLSKSSRVLDPWNGSGTTTFAASKLMLNAVGIDINPVMVIVARARALPSSEADSLVALARHLLSRAEQEPAFEPSDLLGAWFGPSTSNWLRSLEKAVRISLTSDRTQAVGEVHGMSALAATYYVAIFTLCRQLTSAYTTSNPTWLKVVKTGHRRVSATRTWMSARFIEIVAGMAEALSLTKIDPSTVGVVDLIVADSAKGLGLNGQVDFVLTSPPYCTRIDYTAATRMQLAVIAPLLRVRRGELSRQMLGSIRVPERDVAQMPEWGPVCNKFLDVIKKHPSKASAGYYFKTNVDYFDKMYRSLRAVSDSLRHRGAAVFVVQDSYYKEVHNDLPMIIAEMAAIHGLQVRRREDFWLTKTLAGSHPYAKKYRKSFEATESVICFEKV